MELNLTTYPLPPHVTATLLDLATRSDVLILGEFHGTREVPQLMLGLLDDLAADPRIAQDHRLHAVRGHLLQSAGDPRAARSSYLAAAERTTSVQVQRYLYAQAARLEVDPVVADPKPEPP